MQRRPRAGLWRPVGHGLQVRPSDILTEQEIAEHARRNFGFKEVKWLTGNVGYIRLDPEEEYIDTTGTLLLSAYGEWTKKSGIGRMLSDWTFNEMSQIKMILFDLGKVKK